MHGFNQGASYLCDLSLSTDVIFTQEHWLPPSGLSILNNLCDDFVCFSSSAMGNHIDRGTLSGRPFGVLLFLFVRILQNFVM